MYYKKQVYIQPSRLARWERHCCSAVPIIGAPFWFALSPFSYLFIKFAFFCSLYPPHLKLQDLEYGWKGLKALPVPFIVLYLISRTNVHLEYGFRAAPIGHCNECLLWNLLSTLIGSWCQVLLLVLTICPSVPVCIPSVIRWHLRAFPFQLSSLPVPFIVLYVINRTNVHLEYLRIWV